MDETSVEAVKPMADFISQYGFTVVCAAIVMTAVVAVVALLIRVWSKREDARIAAEAKRTEDERELAKKERLASMELNSNMYKLVTEVQTAQVEEMKKIGTVISMLKDDIRGSVTDGHITRDYTEKNTGAILQLIGKVESVQVELQGISSKVDACTILNQKVLDIIKGNDSNGDITLPPSEG